MSLKLGNDDVAKVMLGSTEVSAVYRGTDEVWSVGGDDKGAWGVRVASSQGAIFTFDKGYAFPTSDWTVEVWYKNTGSAKNAYDALFGSWASPPSAGWMLGFNMNNTSGPNDDLALMHLSYSDTYPYKDLTKNELKEWNHVALVKRTDTGTLDFYINGTVANSVSASSYQWGGHTNFHCPGSGARGSADGVYSNLRISNIARYKAPFNAPTEPFQADANTLVLALNSPDVMSEQTGRVTVAKSTGMSTKDSPFTEWPEVQLQLIAGGGGSRNASPNGSAYGAGGAGGFREEAIPIENGKRYDITVGAGGGINANGPTSRFKCSDDIFNTDIKVDGGGKSGAGAPTVEFGGSGGGGQGKLNSGKNGGNGGKYGFNGGKGGGSSTTGAGGAGGGASGQPAEALNGSAKAGGPGKLCFDGAMRAGGGGGSSATQRANGSDGGGRGATPGGTATAGTAYTGGGAGGTCPSGTSGANGASGGSGCVLVKSQVPATAITAGSEISNPSNDGYLYRFYNSGNITF